MPRPIKANTKKPMIALFLIEKPIILSTMNINIRDERIGDQISQDKIISRKNSKGNGHTNKIRLRKPNYTNTVC